MIKKKVIAFLNLITIFIISFLFYGCVNSTKIDQPTDNKQIPDYSKENGLKFNYFGSGPTDGIINLDGEQIINDDYRTIENYQIFKEAGFNWLLLGSYVRPDNCDSKEDFLKKHGQALANMNEVGFDHIIISDYRFTNILSRVDGGLIGRGKMFADEQALDEYIASCISWYKDIPGIDGVQLGDEPCYTGLESFSQIFKSLRRVWPEAFIWYNFFAFGVGSGFEIMFGKPEPKDNQSMNDAMIDKYIEYITRALDLMGPDAKYISIDSYPMTTNGISIGHIATLQICADIAKKRGIDFYCWTQSMAMNYGSNLYYRGLKKEDCIWMNNMLLGFGIDTIGYYHYATGTDNSSYGENWPDGYSFVDNNSEKTYLYDIYQEINEKNQSFANVILNFDYRGCKPFISNNTRLGVSHVALVNDSFVLKGITNVEIDKECAIINELYDVKKKQYMYMIMNVIDSAQRGSKAYQTITVTFDDKYTNAVVYKNGVPTIVELKDHKFIVEQWAGEAVFVLPY